MLIGNKILKRFVVFMLVLIAACNTDKNSIDYQFFENGSKCDSTYLKTNEDDKTRTLYCFKNGTKSFIKLGESQDTVAIKKYFNKYLLEKIRFENNQVIEKSLLFNIDGFEHLLLKFYYRANEILEEKSLYFQFREEKDSIYFRFNPKNNELVQSDSIWVSDFIDHYPVYDQLFEIKYSIKESRPYKWISIPKDRFNEGGNIITTLIYSGVSQEEIENSVRFIYLDNIIYKWCKRNAR